MIRWIGQHIYDYVSRFRNDVYLEDISSGTIASGGNLGLDSNNKIVKAAVSSGGISFDGSTANGVLTYKDADEATVEQYLGFRNASNISTLSLFSNEDTGDNFSIQTTTHGATTLITVDDDAEAAHFEVAADGNITLDSPAYINLEIGDAKTINLVNGTNTFGRIYAEDGNNSEFRLNEQGGSSTADYFSITVGEHGETTLGTIDAAASAANMKLDADGTITLDSIGGQTFSDSTGAFRFVDTDNLNDYFQVDIGSNGDTTLTTVDANAAAAHFEVAADGDITLDAAGDIILEAGGDDLTLDANKFTFTSATSQNPEIQIVDSTNDADGSRLKLVKNRNGNGSAGVDDDLISAIQFSSYNDAGTPEYTVYSQILGNIVDKTNGQETGNMRLQVAAHGGGLETGLTLTGGSQDDEVDVTVGLGANSVVTVPGRIVDKRYRILQASFRDDIGTDKHYVPLAGVDEQTVLTRADACAQLAVCDGRLVSATVRVESMSGGDDAFTLTMGVETNTVGSSYEGTFAVTETEDMTANTYDDHHAFHFVFDNAKHWDSTDMFAVSIQSTEDHFGSNERWFVTLVVEDDWSTYLGGNREGISSTEFDTAP